jgi:hypothetical protein
VWWAIETGFLDQSVGTLPSPAARLWGNILATGRAGGLDLHLRVLREAGVTLLGHFLGTEGRRARFAPDLGEGASTAAPGLCFVGVHFLRTRKSSLLCGVGEDAAIVARQIAS